MSRRKISADALRAQHIVSSRIKDLYASKITPHGLPDDILLRALDGYGSTDLSWSALRDKGTDFRKYVTAHVSDCTIRHVFRRPLGKKLLPAASVSIFRLVANQLRHSDTLFGAYIHTFTFWPGGLWFLCATDPVCTTDHLHQRLVARAAGNLRSLAQAQDDLSILWPTLLQLHQQRRSQGRRGDVGHLITPLDDGLIFGDFQRNDFDEPAIAAAAPHLIEFRNGSHTEQRLRDFYSVGNERAMVMLRTYVGGDQLKDAQRRLKTKLDGYIRRHPAIIKSMMLRARLAFDGDAFYGREHYKLYVSPSPTVSELKNAMSELDEITSSRDWSEEINRSIENQARGDRSRRRSSWRTISPSV